jgi:hypothetical protein
MPAHTPRSPVETPTSLPCVGSCTGAPIRLWLDRPIETSWAARWTPTQRRPESGAAATGSAPTWGL